jgi:hypothetical protein
LLEFSKIVKSASDHLLTCNIYIFSGYLDDSSDPEPGADPEFSPY